MAFLCAAALPRPAAADPALARPFSSGAVLQRDRPIVIRGTADPGERISVRLGAEVRQVRADDRGGWQATLPAMPAGGPFRLTATGVKAEAVAEDILIGDVWLCSGQSNMELPVQRSLNWPNELNRASDPQLRLLSVPPRSAATPQSGIGGAGWQRADRNSVIGFSAACYYMVRDLRTSRKIPIGAIDASYGGTRIRPWLPEAAGVALPGEGDSAAMLTLYRRDAAAAGVRFVATWEDWWRRTSRQAVGVEPWRAPDRLAWQPVPQVGAWDDWGVPKLDGFAGLLWFRRTVTLSPEQAKGAARLTLGRIEDMDVVWINGVAIGTGYGGDVRRDYAVPPGVLRPGANEIVVSVLNTAGIGGFLGPADALALVPTAGGAVPLTTDWRYAVASPAHASPPRTPWESRAGLGTIFNAMVAPLGPVALTGVAWYQGESDSSLTGYDVRLEALMRGWRAHFQRPDLPFLIVSLAGFGAPSAEPIDSGRAQVREDQRQVATRDPHAALVVAIDLGDRWDIHPANKQEVGHRLARAAGALVYGTRETPTGPRVRNATLAPGGVTVHFQDVAGALRTWSSDRPIGFELCAAAPDSCRWAAATVEGMSVRLASDGRPASRVRYAWGNTPVVNLYDDDRLPVGPFEVPIGR